VFEREALKIKKQTLGKYPMIFIEIEKAYPTLEKIEMFARKLGRGGKDGKTPFNKQAKKRLF
jgi:hypothetical protein